MSGRSITTTNVGVFGVDTSTPILDSGKAAILCFGAMRQMPWVVKGRIKPHWVTRLGLWFDHRLVNGDLGPRFLADVAAILHDLGPDTRLGLSPAELGTWELSSPFCGELS